jgi:hypothetical protein
VGGERLFEMIYSWHIPELQKGVVEDAQPQLLTHQATTNNPLARQASEGHLRCPDLLPLQIFHSFQQTKVTTRAQDVLLVTCATNVCWGFSLACWR